MSRRILFVTESLFPLGPAQQLKILADALDIDQWDVHVAVLGEKTFEPVEWTEFGIQVYFLNGDDRTPLNTIRDGFFVVSELRKLIGKLEPEIIHAWCGVSELLTLLATQDIPFGKRLRRFRLLSTELYRQPDRRFIRRRVEKRLAGRVEKRIVPHVSLKRQLLEKGVPDDQIEVIPNAIASSHTSDRNVARKDLLKTLNLPETAYLAGAVAPLSHRTRLKDLIWATDLLTVIRDDFHFLIIGRGNQLSRLKRFAGLTESRSHVHFLGEPVFPQRMVSGLNFFWHSHLRDPISGILLSAMADGVPAISVYGPGTEEVIRHQQTGFGVNFGARDEFARWTKFLIERTEPAQQLAWQGQDFVHENFSQSRMIEGYRAIYDIFQ